MNDNRGGSRTAATSKMEHFVIIVNGWKQFVNIIITYSLKQKLYKIVQLDTVNITLTSFLFHVLLVNDT